MIRSRTTNLQPELIEETVRFRIPLRAWFDDVIRRTQSDEIAKRRTLCLSLFLLFFSLVLTDKVLILYLDADRSCRARKQSPSCHGFLFIPESIEGIDEQTMLPVLDVPIDRSR